MASRSRDLVLPRAARRLALVLLCGLQLFCGPPDEGPQEPGAEPRTGPLALEAPPPQDLLPGGRLRLKGRGFQPAQRAKMRLHLVGQRQRGAESGAVNLELPAQYVSATELRVALEPELFRQLAGGDVPPEGAAEIQGTLKLTMEQGTRGFERSAPARLMLRSQLVPQLMAVAPLAVFLEDRVAVRGADLLLEGEGQTVAVLEGSFGRLVLVGQQEGGPPPAQFTPYPRREHALLPVSRGEALLPVRARVLGITPGTLSGKITLINRHASGVETRSEPMDIELSLLRTQLTSMNVNQISRGQRVFGFGAGFLPLDPAGDTATLVRLSGNFTPAIPGAPVRPTEITLVCEVVDSNQLLLVPRPTLDDEGNLVGLGATPGRFVGSITPVVVLGAQQQVGVPLPCGSQCVVDVVPPKQVLYTKFLANFTEGLRRFGLRNLEPEVRAEALAVAARTYAPWYVEVRDTRPLDYDEYTTMEVGGPDPNGAGLFGLDNTEGIDRGNFRLDDYIGGFNAIADVEGSFAFGGVFIESFLAFTQRTKKKNVLATERFDEIFAPFSPELGGRAADRAELDGGPRQAQLKEAVRVLGALIGNTIAHEFGHSVGMAVTGEGSHNPTDNDRELMDSGQNRSFAERAEIDEYRARPSGFNEVHRRYLDRILPRPQGR